MDEVTISSLKDDGDYRLGVAHLPEIVFTKGKAKIERDLAEQLISYLPGAYVITEEKDNARSDSSMAPTDGSSEGKHVGNRSNANNGNSDH